MKNTTLKTRIIIALTIFTIVTISIFIIVQLKHELKMMDRYKKYQANVTVLAVENTWEKILNLSLTDENILELMQKKINNLKESESIDEGYILDKNGVIISSTRIGLKGTKGDYDDVSVIHKAGNGRSIKEFVVIDGKQRVFSLFIPLVRDGNIYFIARIFISLADMQNAIDQIYGPALLIGLLFIFVNIIFGVFLSQIVVKPIGVFNQAAKKISEGNLSLRVKIPTGDELEELADTFNGMTQELVEMKRRAENVNPLTKLPGNIVIMEEVEKKLQSGDKFTVIYCDLDNFKAFNDKYGIHKGDEAITLTSEVFKETIEGKGGPGDFVGHEGGDDFLLLTVPERGQAIADYIMSEFDKRIKGLYDKEDLERGCIVAHARDGSVKEFPIMTISLAGVSNQQRDISSYSEVTNIAAELKHKAKLEKGSCFVLDQRKD